MTNEELADAARLLGPARMVLDRCAESVPGYRAEAADMAQRIVDVIGHPVTDEPPHALVRVAELDEDLEQEREYRRQAEDDARHLRGILGDVVSLLRTIYPSKAAFVHDAQLVLTRAEKEL